MKQCVLSQIYLLAVVVCLVLPGKVFGKTLEARSNNVMILSAPKKGAEELAKLKKGQTIKAKSRAGMYWKVSHNQKTGYVSIMKVKLKKSDSRRFRDIISKEIQKTRNQNDVANNRTRSTVMGVRGLDETSEVKSAGNVRPQLRLVYEMENYFVAEKKINKLEDLVRKEVEEGLDSKSK